MYSGFMILEEDIAEDDEDIVIDSYLDYSIFIMNRKEYWECIFMLHVSGTFISPPSYRPPSNKPPSKNIKNK